MGGSNGSYAAFRSKSCLSGHDAVANIQFKLKMPQMMHRLISLLTKIGLPVLSGQFIFDWYDIGLPAAARHFPTRAALMLILLTAWAAFREHRERKKKPFR